MEYVLNRCATRFELSRDVVVERARTCLRQVRNQVCDLDSVMELCLNPHQTYTVGLLTTPQWTISHFQISLWHCHYRSDFRTAIKWYWPTATVSVFFRRWYVLVYSANIDLRMCRCSWCGRISRRERRQRTSWRYRSNRCHQYTNSGDETSLCQRSWRMSRYVSTY